MTKQLEQKCLTISLVGTTNAGKSTLINNLVGQKVSIVTPKIQTTRVRMNAVTSYQNTQLIITDTPGIFKPKTQLEKFLVKNAWTSIKNTDIVILLLDCKNYLNDNISNIISRIKKSNINAVLVINKIDLLSKQEIDEIICHINTLHNFNKVFTISALHNIEVNNLINYLCDIAPKGPWLYTEDQVTDVPIKFFTAEITREKLFFNLQQELPYSISVITEDFKENKDKSLVIKQVINVVKESHKTIIVGKKGTNIKKISLEAKKELEDIFETKVHLFLFVKIRKLWQNHLQECVGYTSC